MKFGEKNVGQLDRLLRLAIGGLLVLAILFNAVQGVGTYIAAIAAIAMLATAALGTCGLYSLLGINTCETKKH